MTAISHKLLVTVSEISSSLLTTDLVLLKKIWETKFHLVRTVERGRGICVLWGGGGGGGGQVGRCYASRHVVHFLAYEYFLRQGNTKAR